jgi:sirohydrochlorin cobaltochelatase
MISTRIYFPLAKKDDMSITLENVLALEALEIKLRAILPELYQDSYEAVVPVSMGSAGLKYGADGLVAWDEMWASFCDLAMAGGPPHRGTLLQPATEHAASANPEAHQRVLKEICRGISLVTGLTALPASLEGKRHPCWIAVRCRNTGMAGWLVRAIVMENVLAWHESETLFLPVGPEFRLAKEIKNVITVIAKTCHYWTNHMTLDQHESIDLMVSNASNAKMDSELLEPALVEHVESDPDSYRRVVEELTREITKSTGCVCFSNRYTGWIGIDCPNVRTAIWLMRAMVVENILARREESVLFLPVHPRFAANGRMARLVQTFQHFHRLHGIKTAQHCPPEDIAQRKL